MLRILIISSFFFCLNSYACWLARGDFSIDGEAFPILQKFDKGKDYVISGGTFLLHLRLQKKEQKLSLTYSLEERKGTKLILITKGEEQSIAPGKHKEIFAKGLPGQPHSIISLTFENI